MKRVWRGAVGELARGGRLCAFTGLPAISPWEMGLLLAACAAHAGTTMYRSSYIPKELGPRIICKPVVRLDGSRAASIH